MVPKKEPMVPFSKWNHLVPSWLQKTPGSIWNFFIVDLNLLVQNLKSSEINSIYPIIAYQIKLELLFQFPDFKVQFSTIH